MPPKGHPKKHGTQNGAPKNGQQQGDQHPKKPQQPKKKHADPYAVVGQSLDEIVKSIEEIPVKKPKAVTIAQPSEVPATSSNTVAEAGHAVTATKSNRKRNKKKNGASTVPVKAGMTKAQRSELHKSRREQVKGRPLPNADDFEEEEEEHHNNSNEDYSDTQNERSKEYRKGGYHPVVIGDVYNDRYRIIKKLGWGYFSTVWLVWDYNTNTYQAMKVQKSADHYKEAAYDEIRLLSEIMAADENRDRCCARMNDYFEHVGPNGTHVCMVFDVLGENLLTLMEWYEYRGIPLPIVKAIAQQVLIGLEHIHSIDILHTDLKPENVLLSTPKHKIISLMKHYKAPPIHKRPSLITKDVKAMTKSQKRRYYQKLKRTGGQLSNTSMGGDDKKSADESNNNPAEDDDSQTPTPRTGESSSAPVVVANNSSLKSEDFALPDESQFSDTDPEWEVERFHHVCLADFGNSCWTYRQFTDEVQTRQYRSPEVILGNGYSTPIDLWSAACMFFELITGEFLFDPKQGDNYSRDEDHLALMSELLGELPEGMRLGNGKFRSQFYNSRGELRNIKQLNLWSLPDILHQKYRFTKKKASEIAEFLLPMLVLDPEERATATEMLNSFQHFFEVQDDDYAPFCYVPPEDRQAGSRSASNDSNNREEDANRSNDDSTDTEADAPPKRASSSDEAELRKWWSAHPLLNEEALEERGLTIKDVQLALANLPLDTIEKQEEVERLIVELDQYEQAKAQEEDEREEVEDHSEGDEDVQESK